jgi:hypothetical protein
LIKRIVQIGILLLFAVLLLPAFTPLHAASCEFTAPDDAPASNVKPGPLSIGLDLRAGDKALAAALRESFAHELEKRHPGSAIAEGPRPPPGSLMVRLGTGGNVRWFPVWSHAELNFEGKMGKEDVKRKLEATCKGLVNRDKFIDELADHAAITLVNAVESTKQ